VSTEDVFELPAFDVPQKEPPAPVSYETAMAALEEIAEALRLREEPSRAPENIPRFDM
jgi:hypothetical protein